MDCSSEFYEDKTEHSNPLYIVQVYKCISEFGGLQGKAIASYFKMVLPQVYNPHVVSRGAGGILPRKILLILEIASDAIFWPQISYVLQFLPNRISIVAATRTPCKAADCA